MFAELLPWLNLLLIPVLGFVMNIERRIVRLETIHEVTKKDGEK